LRERQTRPCFAATMMGVTPYRDIDHAARSILKYLPEAPCLPALTRSIRWMLEGLPCLVFDRVKKNVYFDLSTEREPEIIEFYDRYEADDLDYFKTTPQIAPFIYEMIDRICGRRPPELKWVVFHTAGPLLFGDFLKQANGQPSIYNETLRDILIKGMNIKARSLAATIHAHIPDVEVVVDLPETTLVTFTSAGGTGTREGIIDAIDASFAGIDDIRWVHCCANIDWTLLTDATIDVINFDAYQHIEQILLYAPDLNRFLQRGGMLAWGIVPVDGASLEKETTEGLIEKISTAIDRFSQSGVDERLLVESSWVMPACDMVLLSPEEADRALMMTSDISRALRRRYNLQ